MKSELATSSPDMGVGYSQTSFSDTSQLSLLSGMDMPAKSSEKEQQTDGFQACECGKGTCDCLTHPSTPEAWTSFMRDSLAKTLASLESKQAYLREPDQVFTEKSCASLAWYDQSSSSWKTYQQSLVTDWEPYSETWPRWGMTVGGSAYAHPMSERRITETDGFCWPTPTTDSASDRSSKYAQGGMPLALAVKIYPTPTARDGKGPRGVAAQERKGNPADTLPNFVKMFPTPNASDCRDRGNMSMPSIQRRAAIGKQLNLSMVVHPTSGALNPPFVEWLMGFPIEFTVSKDWVTPKSRSKRQQPTNS